MEMDLVLKEIDSIFATETDVGIIQARMNAIQLRLYCEHLQGIAEITAKTASPIELLVAHIVGGYLASNPNSLRDGPEEHKQLAKRAQAMAEALYNQRFA